MRNREKKGNIREDGLLLRFQKELGILFPKLAKARVKFQSAGRSGYRYDMVIGVQVSRRKWSLLCEVKAMGLPRQIRAAALRMKEYTKEERNNYPVVIAPYISKEGRRICRELGVGFLDLCGNAYLDFDFFYMEITGRPNLFKSSRGIKSPFTPASERVLRVLLTNPEPNEVMKKTIRVIAKEANVGQAQPFKVFKRLEELNFIVKVKGEKKLQVAKLLNAWRESYSYNRNQVLSLYSLQPLDKIEIDLSKFCKNNNIRYALSLFSGAKFIAPFTRYTFAAAYYSGDLERLKKTLGLKEVDSGPNLLILIPYDEGVYYGSKRVGEFTVVNPVQLYLDLYNYGGRGKEQAEFLRRQVLRV